MISEKVPMKFQHELGSVPTSSHAVGCDVAQEKELSRLSVGIRAVCVSAGSPSVKMVAGQEQSIVKSPGLFTSGKTHLRTASVEKCEPVCDTCRR